MKSGTWLLHEIIEQLTGLSPYEPVISNDSTPDYKNEMLIEFPPEHFFGWHSTITDRTKALLLGAQSRNLFLVRNIYDVLISMLCHLAYDVDASLGRSTKNANYFHDKSPEDAITLIISGFLTPNYRWDGLEPHLEQMASMMEMAINRQAKIISYERLTTKKKDAVADIADFFKLEIAQDKIDKIAFNTEFDIMKQDQKFKTTQDHFTPVERKKVKQYITQQHIDMIEILIRKHFPRKNHYMRSLNLEGIFTFTL